MTYDQWELRSPDDEYPREFHASGFKPIECRMAFGCRDAHPNIPSVREMRARWQTLRAQEAIQLWRERVR